MERFNDVEAVDVRHHQIQHDQVRQLTPRGIDGLVAAVRAQYGTGQAQHADGDEFHGLGVVINDQDFQCVSL